MFIVNSIKKKIHEITFTLAIERSHSTCNPNAEIRKAEVSIKENKLRRTALSETHQEYWPKAIRALAEIAMSVLTISSFIAFYNLLNSGGATTLKTSGISEANFHETMPGFQMYVEAVILFTDTIFASSLGEKGPPIHPSNTA